LLDYSKDNNAASVCITRKEFNNHPKAYQVPKWKSFTGGSLLEDEGTDEVHPTTDNEGLTGTGGIDLLFPFISGL